MVKILNKFFFLLIILFEYIQNLNELKSFSFQFTKWITLDNNNYLVCTEKGIYTYDFTFEEPIYNITFEKEIESDYDFSFTTISKISNKEDNFIIILYRYYFYFLYSYGKLIFSSSVDISSNIIEYYSLIPYIKNDKYYFIVPSIASQFNLAFYFFEINISSKSIVKTIYEKETIEYNGKKVTSFLGGLNCKIMIYNSVKEVLTCFHSFFNLGVSTFDIENNFSSISELNNLFHSEESPYIIKVETNTEKNEALICINYVSNKIGKCLIYYINSHNFSDIIDTINCDSYLEAMNLIYDELSKEFIFSCISNNKIEITKFNENFEKIFINENGTDENELSLPEFDYIHSYSVIYCPKYNNFLLMIEEAYFEGKTFSKVYLLPDIYNESIIFNNDYSSIISFIQPSTNLISTISSSYIHSSNLTSTISSSYIHSFIQSIIYSTIIDSPTMNISSSNIKCIKYSFQNECFENIPNGYYLIDKKSNIIKKCHDDCELCNDGPIIDNTNCDKCKDNTKYLKRGNCVLECGEGFYTNQENICISKNYYYYDEDKKNFTFLEANQICPEEFFYENIIYKECKHSCTNQEFINNTCIITYLNENNIKNITEKVKNIMNNSEINNETNIFIQGRNVIYQIISYDVEKNSNDIKLSKIDFGKCEIILKNYYSLDFLIIIKNMINSTYSLNNIVNYEVYDPYTLKKLDLSICENEKILISIPYILDNISLNEYIKLSQSGYDLFNPNDKFYKDICSPFSSDNNTDVLLIDRKKDYFKIISFCEENCTYKSYDYINNKVQCECEIKKENTLDFYNFIKAEFIPSFYDKDSFSNFKTLSCYKLNFSKLGQANNIGSYVLIGHIILFIITSIIFYCNQKKEISRIFKDVINQYNLMCDSSKEKNENISNNKTYNRDKNINKKITIKTGIYQNKNIHSSMRINKNISEELKNSIIGIYSKNKLISIKHNKIKINQNLNNKVNSNNGYINYIYNDEELDNLNYIESIKFDKRTCLQFYLSLLKRKHLIIFTFLSKFDYNIFIIKLSLFIFSHSLYITVNTIFFEDNSIHKIYENNGKWNFLFELPSIIYSTIISVIINFIVKKLALSSKDIIKIKKIKNKSEILEKIVKCKKYLKLKISLFYIIGFFFIIFFWYFVSTFCSVFKNCQIILFKEIEISFLLSLLYPFIINIFPILFRIYAIRSKDKKCLFYFGKFLSYF